MNWWGKKTKHPDNPFTEFYDRQIYDSYRKSGSSHSVAVKAVKMSRKTKGN